MKKSILRTAISFCILLNASVIFAQPVLEKIGEYKCGKQPKQVLFSPDQKVVVLPLLDDNGFDIFDVNQKKVIKRINPPDSDKLGFAEGLFIPEKNSFFVSQMTTGKIYEYSYPGFQYIREIDTKGTWSKFIAYLPEKDILAVSNWVSNNISILDYKTGNLIRLIPTKAAPRGMVFTEKGKYLISLSFDNGVIEKFNVEDGKKVDSIYIENAAMRHIVMDSSEKYAFVSDMYHRSIMKIDLTTFKVVKTVKVFKNPNTIDLLNDRWLFVSCRGPNNTQDYTKRSPENGKIYILDVNDLSEVKIIDGGNQPTGLDVSSDGKMLCFSNFQDENIELYNIK